jgi:hypothetical protein
LGSLQSHETELFPKRSGSSEKLAGTLKFVELLAGPAVSSHTMTLKQNLSVLVAAAGLSALGGCVAPPLAVVPQESTKYSVENTDKFVPLDADSQVWVACTGLQERRLGDGRLEVVADVKNRVRAGVVVEVECIFEDDKGLPSGAPVPWRIVNLPVDSTEAVRFVAPDANAAKYSIHVREYR